MLGRGNEVRGMSCYTQPVMRKFVGTVDGSGVVTTNTAESDPGISFSDFSSGLTTVTFSPKPRKACLLSGRVLESAADRLRAAPTSDYSVTAGTLALNFRADDDGTAENPADTQVVECFFILDEGAS